MTNSKRVMKLIDPVSGRMVCRVCGAYHYATRGLGGRFVQGSQTCRYGCARPPPNVAAEEKKREG
jgi:hypothetical protein